MSKQITTPEEPNELTPLQEQINSVGMYPAIAQQNITFIQENLKELWNMAVEVGNDALAGKIAEICSRSEMLADHIGHQAIVLNTIAAGLFKVWEQRNKAFDELDNLHVGIQNIWTTEHPLLQGMYDRLMQSHNEAFWESLPYDMANMMGGDWDFINADTLYLLLTIDEELVDEDPFEYGFTLTQLREFRGYLLEMVQQIKTEAEEMEYE
jgi:hypothetical protein